LNKIILLKTIDTIVGPFILSILNKRRIPQASVQVRSVLFIRPGGIGDAVYLIPILSLLKQTYPDATIDVLAEQRNAAIFLLSPHVRTIFHYDNPRELLACLKMRYDVVIDSEQWHRLSAVVAAFIKADLRIGFGTNERSRIFHHSISYSHDDHELISFRRLLEPLIGGENQPSFDEPFFHIPEGLLANTREKHEFPEQPFVAIAPGASITERRWGGERYAEVADELSRKGYLIVVIGIPSDTADAALIAQKLPNTIDLTGKTNLQETAVLLAASRLFIGADSGLLHIAVALGIPTVSIFGSGREKKWAPQGNRHRVINKHLPCSPCTTFGNTPSCPYDGACMKQISPKEVIAAADKLLQ